MSPTAALTGTTTRTYVTALRAQWDAELADQPAATNGIPWASTSAALVGLPTLGTILDAIGAAPAEGKDEILHALLSNACAGSQLAARAVLQTMLPAVMRQARTAAGRNLEDPIAAAGAAMWEAITTYPLRRRHRVAANLTLEALRLLEACVTVEVPVGDEVLEVLEGALVSDGEPDPWEAAAALVAWALDQGVISQEEGRLLAEVHLGDEAMTSRQVAARWGCSAASLRQRHSRLVRRLSHEVAMRLGEVTAGDLVDEVRLRTLV